MTATQGSPRGSLKLAFMPADGRKWSSPIVFDRGISWHSFRRAGTIGLDMTSIPDGRYHAVLCQSLGDCQRGFGVLQREGKKVARFLRVSGQKRSGDKSLRKNRTWRALNDRLIGLVGVDGYGLDLWVEQGRFVRPSWTSGLFNGRIVPREVNPILKSFVEPTANPATLHLFDGAKKGSKRGNQCFKPVKLIGIDMAGLGVRLMPREAGIRMDVDGNGRVASIPWVSDSKIGFMYLDSDRDGQIEGFGDLIGMGGPRAGDRSAKGSRGRWFDFVKGSPFQSLLGLDGNGDLRFDVEDEMFARGGFWFDFDRDGAMESRELRSFARLGISGIDLRVANLPEGDGEGNAIIFKTNANRTKGRKPILVFDLRLNPGY